MTVTSLTWQNLAASPSFADPAVCAEWNRLNSLRSNLPFLDTYALGSALRVFGRGDERLLVGRDAGKVRAMFLLQRCGYGRWQTVQPSQVPLGAWVAEPGLSLPDLARQLLRGPLGASLVLSITQVDPAHAPREPDGPDCLWTDYIETGWIDIEGTFDAYWAQRGKNLRSNMRKQQNKLSSEGVAGELLSFTAAADMVPALERYGQLESAGWKAGQGTAIHPDNDQGRFYRQLLEQAASRGEALVYEYRLDGRTVASNLCLTRAGTLVVLKTTYDESVDKSLSPAFLLHLASLRTLFEDARTNRLEYFGRFMEWHSRWTEKKRTLHHLTSFRWPWLKKIRQMASAPSDSVAAPSVAGQDSGLKVG
ncbi:MAG: GNAT family N-acetyltransferase [Burkholderiaceae bacterium]|nr:GNAT family N-acetyltransferase [Burkholderiaceae bacterium]